MDSCLKISNYLLYRSAYVYTPGLYHGKTGVVLALGLYAEAYGNKILKNCVLDLFEELYDMIHDGMSVGMENGLCGIGYGITLMRKSGVIECDLNDVLYEIDSRIMDYDPRRMKDMTYRKGVAGIIRYIRTRQLCPEGLESLNQSYRKELEQVANHYNIDKRELSKDLLSDLAQPQWNKSEYLEKDLSIDGGVGYFLIKESYEKIFPNR